MTGELVRFPEGALRRFAEAALTRLGSPRDEAAIVAESLLDADRRGVHTHGLVRLPSYAAQVRAGDVVPGVRPEVIRSEGATAAVDGRSGFGAPLAVFAMDRAIACAGQHGIGIVTVRGAGHFGTASFYARRALAHGFIGFSATNTPKVMAPWGGREARLGNNPFAVAAPMPSARPPFVLDIAQTNGARGKIKLAQLRGAAIPDGWALGPDGRSTRDATAALDGALLPFGGHKGYGLALVVEILAGVLSGAQLSFELVNTGFTAAPAELSDDRRTAVGNVHVAVDPARFTGLDAFVERMEDLAVALESSAMAPGTEEILLPGELEVREEERAARLGVALETPTVAVLRDYARHEMLPEELFDTVA